MAADQDALHYVIGTAKDAWQRGNFLDIKGAFPSIILDQLIHNMHRRGIPQEYTEWIQRKVKGRETIVSFDDYNTTAMEIR